MSRYLRKGLALVLLGGLLTGCGQTQEQLETMASSVSETKNVVNE